MKYDEHAALPPPELTTPCSRLRRDKMSFAEETGFRAASWRYLCSTQAFTMDRYPLHSFLATDLSLAPLDHGEDGEGEDINVCLW